MISEKLQKEIENMSEFAGLELSPPMTIEEVSKSLYVNWDTQNLLREYPWRAWAQLDGGLRTISVRGKNEEDAIERLKKEIKK
jgi:hypothetical protein